MTKSITTKYFLTSGKVESTFQDFLNPSIAAKKSTTGIAAPIFGALPISRRRYRPVMTPFGQNQTGHFVSASRQTVKKFPVFELCQRKRGRLAVEYGLRQPHKKSLGSSCLDTVRGCERLESIHRPVRQKSRLYSGKSWPLNVLDRQRSSVPSAPADIQN